jgi:hypothetical protein
VLGPENVVREKRTVGWARAEKLQKNVDEGSRMVNEKTLPCRWLGFGVDRRTLNASALGFQ